jgi:phosphohistidine phosphatase
MLTLSLLRHAKSSWDDPGLSDFDRPLAKRGVKAARRMGAFMAEKGLAPDLVLCSSAERARATLALVLPELPRAPHRVLFEDGLYLAEAGPLLKRLRRLPKGVRHVLLVGHNPGLEDLVLELVGKGSADELAALRAKFPTAALAVVEFEQKSWRDIEPGSGRLALFMTPARLA